MLHTKILALLSGFLIWALTASTADAQLFGRRSLGRPFQPRGGTLISGAQEGGGTLEGNERFLRENRGRSQFVGTDRRELSGFVGAEQAIGVGRVPTAVESLQPPPDRSAQINRPLGLPGPDELAYPRLVIDFEPASESYRDELREPSRRLKQAIDRRLSSPIEVLVEGQTAILRGEVASARQKELVEILASFEPGIYAVRNELQVRETPDSSSSPANPAARAR